MVQWTECWAWKAWTPPFTHFMTLERSLPPQSSHLKHDNNTICLPTCQGWCETEKDNCTEGFSLPKTSASFYPPIYPYQPPIPEFST